MPESKKMRCGECATEMNYHAEKLDLTAALSQPEDIYPELGGILEEAHTCPDCGKTVTRRVRPSKGPRK